MGLLKDFFGRNKQTKRCRTIEGGKVISLLDKRNQNIEKRLAHCMKEIQGRMVNKNSPKRTPSRLEVITFDRTDPTPA